MKHSSVILLLLCCSTVWLQAQRNEAQTVATAVQRLNGAMIDAEESILYELTSKDLSYGHSSGLVEDRETFVAAITEGRSGFSSIELTEQSIAFSDGVAIVRHKFSAGTDNKGQPPGSVNLAVMQIWKKERGKWVLVARQATKI